MTRIRTLIQRAQKQGYRIDPIDDASGYLLVANETAQSGLPPPVGLMTLEEIDRFIDSIEQLHTSMAEPMMRLYLIQHPTAALIIHANQRGLQQFADAAATALRQGQAKTEILCLGRRSQYKVNLYIASLKAVHALQQSYEFAELL